MENKDLIKRLKGLPEESEVFYDDKQGGLLEIAEVQMFAERRLKAIGRADLTQPAIVLSDTGADILS